MQRIAVERRSSGCSANSRVICGSSSTSVIDSTERYLRISRTAMPSPPPSTSTFLRRALGQHRRMDQRLVIAVFVARMELQVAVEEQADAAAPGGHDDALVGAAFAVDHASA